MVRIIGGGLAGSEAAWQVASRGVPVTLYEMRPVRPTEVHKTDRLAELVCSNSFRGDKLDNAVGLLKEEMRRLGSLVMRAAEAARVPAGAALAVDRDRFSQAVTDAIASHPLITLERREIDRVPEPDGAPWIIATGPTHLGCALGRHRAPGRRRAPVLLRRDQPDRAGRVDRSRQGVQAEPVGSEPSRRWPELKPAAASKAPACGIDDGQGDYLNCPFTKDEYDRFYDALVGRRIGDGARLRQGEVLRRVPADRGDGAPRTRHAALWPDETGRAGRSADGSSGVRRRAVAAGQSGRRPLEPGRLSDAVEVGRAGTRAAHDPRSGTGRVRALRHGASQHLHQRPDRAAADVADACARAICSLPGR